MNPLEHVQMLDALRTLRGEAPRQATPNRQARRAAEAERRRRARKVQRMARKRHR